ncbi:hypothetical protein [Paraglaciecola chathamensis]|mgnify:CR=1 FL=1|uniref:Uncharacterized protein n=1 Tax=Paraglaciecola chathamensis TaxID=368405 RepID=A0A8H9IE19_9ALTE|nr:hypothetical protein [Paraglaciecola oceanifecundans]GGZ83146.1 hypothetical protein GCM10011274_45960 [Paraglaciecola oceanifecundans]
MFDEIINVLAKGKFTGCNISVQVVMGQISCAVYFEQPKMAMDDTFEKLFESETGKADDVVALRNALSIPLLVSASSGDELLAQLQSKLESITPTLNQGAAHYGDIDIKSMINAAVDGAQSKTSSTASQGNVSSEKGNDTASNPSADDDAGTPNFDDDIESL